MHDDDDGGSGDDKVRVRNATVITFNRISLSCESDLSPTCASHVWEEEVVGW